MLSSYFPVALWGFLAPWTLWGAFDSMSYHACAATPLGQLHQQHPACGAEMQDSPLQFQVAGGGGWRGQPSAPLPCLGRTGLCLSSSLPGEMASAGSCFSALLLMLLPRAARLITVEGLPWLQGGWTCSGACLAAWAVRAALPAEDGQWLGPFSL